MKLQCPNGCVTEIFYAKITEYHSCRVNTNGVFVEDMGCDDADRPTDFICPRCESEVDFVYVLIHG